MSEVAFSHDIRLLSMSDAAMDHMRGLGFTPTELPPGTFSGIDEPIVLPGSTTVMIANVTMDEDVAYRITRSIIENFDSIKSDLAGLRNWTLERAADVELGGGAPLHPGAERAYREAGII
jgi:TRAP transporter TAXI family solute receptor